MATDMFPTVFWGATRVQFLPLDMDVPSEAVIYAALVFAFTGPSCIVVDIIDRGWCIPSGHLEAGETPEQAAHREAMEEAGLILGPIREVGRYLLEDFDPPSCRIAPVFIADVSAYHAIPAGSESRGIARLTLNELPQRYYRWDPLIAAVAHYAFKLHDA